VGALSQRVGFRPPLLAGVALIAAGLLIDSLELGSAEHFAAQWLPVVVVIGCGIGLCYPLLTAAAISGLPSAELAGATAVNQCARQLGAALGVAVAVAALGPDSPAPVERFHVAWLVGAAFSLVAAAAAAGLPGQAPTPQRDVTSSGLRSASRG
jgi:MFS family permease